MKKFSILLFVAVALAADKPLPEVSNLKLVNQYQVAVIAQQSLQAAQAAVQQNQAALTKAVADYHALEAVEAKANGYPEGTTFTVDTTAGKATPVLPPKKDEKAEVKK